MDFLRDLLFLSGGGIDSIIFAAIAVIAFIFLIGILILGEAADFADDFLGFDFDSGVGSFLSTQTILAFLMGFGATGWILTGYGGLGAVPATAWSLGGGFSLMLPIGLLHKSMSRQQGSTNVSEEDAVNRDIVVVLDVPADGLGQGRLQEMGSTRTVTIRTEESVPLRAGEVVKITKSIGGVYYVEKGAG